jgi:patatin-related protein
MDTKVSSTHDAETLPPPASAQVWPLSPACREVRLGLVVYGGVSLAIYINGVADELFRAVRGRGIYKLLKRLLDADIVVDIISGTSAGGINGLLLAYALTNQREFSDCARLWRDHGALSKLLRLTDDEANATSLLDSRNYYIPQLEAAFKTMSRISPDVERAERPSRFDELDLFVTGTNFDGRMTTTVDATGRQIDIKTHRTVFHLKHRANRKEPFAVAAEAASDNDLATVSALARLAAITSCFPAAFEPVHVAPSDGDPHEGRIYELLKEWGQLEGETWFLDGGVLDNKPFSYTIHQIFNRTASRPVERKLLYVEPDPERFDPSARPRIGPPTIVEAATDALLGIPGYESIAEDLERIALRNDRLQRQTRVREAADAAFKALRVGGTMPASAIPPSTMAIYRQVRLSQFAEHAVRGLMEGEGFKRPVETRRRLSEEERRRRASEDRDRRNAAVTLARAFDAWRGVGDETLERFDVYFRVRRTFHTIYKIAGEVSRLCSCADSPAELVASGLEPVRGAWETLNQQLAAYEIVQWAMDQMIEHHRMPRNLAPGDEADNVWRELETKFNMLLTVDVMLIEPLLTAPADVTPDGPRGLSDAQRQLLRGELIRRLEHLNSLDTVAAVREAQRGPAQARNLLQRLDDHTRQLLQDQLPAEHARLIAAWDEFVVYDAHFFPIDYFGDLGEKDPIEVVRISPLDAERAFCKRKFEDKVTGETVMHFGAFLKRSWRSNDIMWGRLDGVCRILDALLTQRSLVTSTANPMMRQLLTADLDSRELDPAAVFPNAGPVIQDQVRQWLRQLASDDELVRVVAASDAEMRTLLLWCAQLEILNTDLPTVLVDAAREQLEWNNLIVTDDKGTASYKRVATRLDLSSVVIAGEELTRAFIDRLKGEPAQFSQVPEAPLAKHFLDKYMIGAENPRDHIPPAVLLETVCAMLLVSRNCLVNAFPDYARRVTSTLFYKALIHWPLTTAHTLAVFARRERPLYIAALTALVTYAVLALGIAISSPDKVMSDGSVDPVRGLALVGIPLLILGPVMQLAWGYAYRDRKRSMGAQVALAILSVVGVVTFLVLAAAFATAWSQTTVVLREWLESMLGIAVADRFPKYALLVLVFVLVLIVPALRGYIQSRVARAAVARRKA